MSRRQRRRRPCGPNAGGLHVEGGTATITTEAGEQLEVTVTGRSGRLKPGEIRAERLQRLVAAGRSDGRLTITRTTPGGERAVTIDLNTHPIRRGRRRYDPGAVPRREHEAYAALSLEEMRPEATESSRHTVDTLVDSLHLAGHHVDTLGIAAAVDAGGEGLAAAAAAAEAARTAELERIVRTASLTAPRTSEGHRHVNVGMRDGADTLLQATCTTCRTTTDVRVRSADLAWWQGREVSAAQRSVFGAGEAETAQEAFSGLDAGTQQLLDTGVCGSCRRPGTSGEAAGNGRRHLALLRGARTAVDDTARLASEALAAVEAAMAGTGTAEAAAEAAMELGRANRSLRDRASDGVGAPEEIVGDLVHHLATPLASVALTADTLRRWAEPGQDTEELLAALRARLQEVAGHLGWYASALESGTGDTASVAEIHRLGTERAGSRAAIDPAPRIGAERVGGNTFLLSRAIWAAATNAQEANMRAGRRSARPFQIASTRTNDGRIAITLSDRGNGIPEGMLANLATPGRTGRPGEGLGLGLATLAAVAETHGGDIHVHTLPGHGTTIILTLPPA